MNPTRLITLKYCITFCITANYELTTSPSSPLFFSLFSVYHGIRVAGLSLWPKLQFGEVLLRQLKHLLCRRVPDRLGLHVGHRGCHAYPLFTLLCQVCPERAAPTHPIAHTFINPSAILIISSLSCWDLYHPPFSLVNNDNVATHKCARRSHCVHCVMCCIVFLHLINYFLSSASLVVETVFCIFGNANSLQLPFFFFSHNEWNYAFNHINLNNWNICKIHHQNSRQNYANGKPKILVLPNTHLDAKNASGWGELFSQTSGIILNIKGKAKNSDIFWQIWKNNNNIQLINKLQYERRKNLFLDALTVNVFALHFGYGSGFWANKMDLWFR